MGVLLFLVMFVVVVAAVATAQAVILKTVFAGNSFFSGDFGVWILLTSMILTVFSFLSIMLYASDWINNLGLDMLVLLALIVTVPWVMGRSALLLQKMFGSFKSKPVS